MISFLQKSSHYSSVLFLVVVMVSSPAYSQDNAELYLDLRPNRSIPALGSVFELRKADETRVWTFTVSKLQIGQLISKVTRHDVGEKLTLESQLVLDYSKLDQVRRLEITATTSLGPSGTYLQDEIDVNSDGNTGEINWKRNGSELRFESKGNGQSSSEKMSLDLSIHPWEPYFVDQLELFLALRSIHVGDSIVDSIFQPQGRTVVPVRGDVPYFMWQEIWKGKIDSVFIIRLSEPMRAQLYYTADRRLIRADFLDENMRIYQDAIVRNQAPVSPSAWDSVVKKFARIQLRSFSFAFLLFFPVALLGYLFARRGVAESGFLLQAGILGVIGGLVSSILQSVLITFIVPLVKSGGAILAGLISAVVLALLTQVILLASIKRFMQLNVSAKKGTIAIQWGDGLFCGLMMGVVGALIVLGQDRFGLFSSGTMEQVLFASLLGIFGGYAAVALARSLRQLIIWFLTGLVTLVVWRMIPASLMSTGVNPGAVAAIYLVLTGLWVGVAILLRLFPAGAAITGKKKR